MTIYLSLSNPTFVPSLVDARQMGAAFRAGVVGWVGNWGPGLG